MEFAALASFALLFVAWLAAPDGQHSGAIASPAVGEAAAAPELEAVGPVAA